MEKLNSSTKVNFTRTSNKLQVIKILEYMRSSSTDQAYNAYCKYCLDIIKQNIEMHYNEVLDFIGIEKEIIPAEVSVEVISIMSMFGHMSRSLTKLSYKAASDIEKEYYVHFCGFEASAQNHLSYYIFLVRNQKHRVPIFIEALPITLGHYREMLKRYERYKGNTNLSKHMLMDLCIRREQQIKFIS